MSERVGQGENSAADRKASMTVEKAPSKSLTPGIVPPVSPAHDIGGKAAGTLGFKSFDL